MGSIVTDAKDNMQLILYYQMCICEWNNHDRGVAYGIGWQNRTYKILHEIYCTVFNKSGNVSIQWIDIFRAN